MSIKLKIKAKYLAEEARIIRREEHKLVRQMKWRREAQGTDTELNDLREDIYRHRIDVVRLEARATHLVRAFLAGKKYRDVEPRSDIYYVKYYVVGKMVDMINKYSDRNVSGVDIKNWLEEK